MRITEHYCLLGFTQPLRETLCPSNTTCRVSGDLYANSLILRERGGSHKPRLTPHLPQRSQLPPFAFVFWHQQSLLDGAGDLVHVRGIHKQSAVQTLRRTGVFGEDQDAAAVLLACDILVADEVHPVTQRGHEADVGDSVESG